MCDTPEGALLCDGTPPPLGYALMPRHDFPLRGDDPYTCSRCGLALDDDFDRFCRERGTDGT